MSVRRAIAEVDPKSINVSRFCAQHGIGRDVFYEIRRRFAAEGAVGLEPRSRAPKRVANRTPLEVEDLIVELRKELLDGGLDAGAATIRYWLERRVGAKQRVPSETTIWRVLTRRGFIVAEPSKAPGRRYRSFAAERANECWQMDATHFELADGTVVEIINVLDDCSRLIGASHAVSRCTLATTWEAITAAGEQLGWPQRMLTDNGSMFGPTFATNLAALGIGIGHSRPYHPQTCGKVERFHLTLKQRLAAFDAPATIAELQALIEPFIDYYNDQRPHRGIGRRTPRDVWANTPHSGPAPQPLGEPTVVYRARVYDGIVWAGRFRISLGAAHNDTTATTIITGRNAHVFIAGRLTRALTINPDRTNQPLHPRPGRPTQ